MFSLKIYKRDPNKKADHYRKENKIPGVIYGPQISSLSIYADKNEFEEIYEKYESGLIEIIFDSQNLRGIIQEVQFHPITDEIIHFDIFVPSLTEKIETRVPLKFVGVAPGIKSGGVLSINLEEVEVECLAEDIPPYFEVDLSRLVNIGDSIYIKDLKVSPQVKLLIPPETPIVSLIKESQITEEETKS